MAVTGAKHIKLLPREAGIPSVQGPVKNLRHCLSGSGLHDQTQLKPHQSDHSDKWVHGYELLKWCRRSRQFDQRVQLHKKSWNHPGVNPL